VLLNTRAASEPGDFEMGQAKVHCGEKLHMRHFFFEAGTAPNLIPKRDGVTDCIAEFNADYTSSVNY
jgi:hypothetical protein